MKILTLYIAMVCFASTGYGQYFDGEIFVGANEIPGLLKQLKSVSPGAERSTILLKIGYGYLYKAGEHEADLDSAMLYARHAKALSTQVNNDSLINESLLLTSMVYMEQKNMPIAKSMLSAMNDSCRLRMLICLSAFYANTRPLAPDNHSLLDSAADYAKAAVKLATELRFRQKVALQRLEYVAAHYRVRHFRDLAEMYYLQVQEYRAGGYPSEARTLSSLSRVYSDEGDFYKALNYGINAEKALNSQSSDEDFSLVNLNLGSLYTAQEKYEQAQVCFGRLLAKPQKYRELIYIYSVANNYCSNLRKLNRTNEILPFLQKIKQQCPIEQHFDRVFYHLAVGDAYKDMNRFKLAENNFLESIRYCDSAGYPPAITYFSLGSLYQQYNHHAKALAAFKMAEKGLANEVMQANNLSYISRSAAMLGNYAEAYDYLVKSKAISDSIYVVSKEKFTQELEVQYQTQKKDAAIEQAAVRRKVTLLIIALLAVIIALLIWLFRAKLRSNKVITHKNVQLQQLVKDKSWLLKEMHHRVKNNLHTIMNLLEFQSVYLHDDALEAIRNSQSRIFAMSLIHQKLYQTDDDAKTIDMAVYIPELVSYLGECFSMHRNCRINIDIEHAVVLHVEEAVPLGLIVNEAVTNSMKYAFKNDQHGIIIISLKASGPDEYELIIADNGTGLPEGIDLDNVPSLGFQLIKGLSAQLNASLHIVNENGLKITLSHISMRRTIKIKTMADELNEQVME